MRLSPAICRLLFFPLLALGLLIAGSPAPAAEKRLEDDLIEIWNCDFQNSGDKKWDINYDHWPDRWTRVRDEERPHYSQIQIETPDTPKENPRLTIRPMGASARVSSPPIRVVPKFSYKLRLRVKVENAVHGQAVVRMEFHSAKGELLDKVESKPVVADGEWHDFELGNHQPRHRNIDRVYVNIDYDRGERSDLDAKISVADLSMLRLPSIRVYTGSEYNVYSSIEDVVVHCELSGILEQNPEVRFQLLDATNRSIGEGGVRQLDGQIISQTSTLASEIVDGFDSDKESYEGAIEWRPPIPDFGYYRVQVGMYSTDSKKPIGEPRAITIAVVRDGFDKTPNGEFGWTLPQADNPLEFEVLQELLPLTGVSLVKLPVWYPESEPERGEQIVRFAEQLSARDIEMIGVLEDPSDRIADPLRELPASPIEGLFNNDTSFWLPMIDHVITKLSMRIQWWQLGGDRDTSFVGFDRIVDRVGFIRNQMFRFGQDIRLGIGWRWDHQKEWDERLSWDFEQMSSPESVDSEKLLEWLSNSPPSTAKRWVMVEPPETIKSARNEVERHQTRVRDFVEQIIVAKVHGADGIFVADPFSGSTDLSTGATGVMNRDGTPGELLLPWRTCARLLGGAKYMGAITMPEGSQNWIFKRSDDRIVMVLWNLRSELSGLDATPIQESLYLGDDVQVIDIWGKTRSPDETDGRQVIPVGRMPRFVLGLNEAVARWRMSTRFERPSVPSVFGATHENAVLVKNEFSQGIGGTMRLHVSTDESTGDLSNRDSGREWLITPDQQRISMPAHEALRAPIQIVLSDADYGNQPIRLDFDLSADRDYRFSVWRSIKVGMGGLDLDVTCRLAPDGRLVVEQRMRDDVSTNSNFKCLLNVRGRRRKRALVFHLGSEVDKKTYSFVNGEELLGKEMRLRIEQIDGPRVLIHRFVAEENSMGHESDLQEATPNEVW